MINAVDQHHLFKAYLQKSSGWKEQTYEQWHATAEEFQVLRKQQGEIPELIAAQAFCAGQAARKLELYEQALEHYQQTMALLPDWPLAVEALAATCYQLGWRREATDSVSLALKLDSSLIQARILYAQMLYEHNNYQAAENVLQLGLKFHAQDPGLHCLLGHIALSDRRLRDAQQCYQRALEFVSDCAEAYTGLSSVYMLEGNYLEALKQVELALKYNQRESMALINRGIIHHKFHQPEHAKEAFDRAIRFAPRNAQVYFRLATFYWQQEDLAKTERYLRLAINSESYRSNYYSALGLLLLTIDQLDNARQHYQQAILLNPEDALALHGLAVLALISDKPEQAEPLLLRAQAALNGSKRLILRKLAAQLPNKLRP